MRGASFCLPLLWLATLSGCSRPPPASHGAVPSSESTRLVAAPSTVAGRDAAPRTGVELSVSPEVPALRAGVYRLTLVAEQGSHRGATSEGALTLVPASVLDKSPTTGEVAKDVYDPPQFYGWTDLDFQRIAAPTGRAPDPTSRDPVRPGVLVPSQTHLKHQVVLIGTVGNLRDGAVHLDGAGIALHVERWKSDCYHGPWDRWGIAVNGSGTFRACRIGNAWSP